MVKESNSSSKKLFREHPRGYATRVFRVIWNVPCGIQNIRGEVVGMVGLDYGF